MDTARAWSILRLLRSDPPGVASTTAHRRRTFNAALEQAEELWRGAAAIPSTASPIILFYALTQGAAALCAARIAKGPWEATPAHGLTLLKPDQREGRRPSLRELQIGTNGHGFVHQVAALLGSPVLCEQVSLAVLLRSLPDHRDFLLLGHDDLLQPLTVHDGTLTLRGTAAPSRDVEAAVGPLPTQLQRKDSADGGRPSMVPPTMDEVVEWFADYPQIARAGRPAAVGHVQPMEITREPDYLVRVRWNLPEPIQWGTSNVWLRSIVDIVDYDEPGAPARGTALPAVGGNAQAQHPLVTWWLVLYACSMLARYHPRAWVSLLDVEKSPSAVPLDHVLDRAHSRLPVLLLELMLRSASAT